MLRLSFSLSLSLSQMLNPSYRVFDHARRVHRFGEIYEAELDDPPPEHLRGGAAVCLGDGPDGGVREPLPLGERTVCLDYDARLLEVFDRLLAVQEGVHLDLVHCRGAPLDVG